MLITLLITVAATYGVRKVILINLFILILKLNKHEKNYFNSSSSIRFVVC
jgi:hypothetical protein